MMRNIESIVKDIVEIYMENGKDANEYLCKARWLKKKFGPGLAILYCWFYSVPQRWTQVEPKIFQLAKHTNSFDLNTVLSMPTTKIVKILKPMIFRNQISIQLKNFCKAINKEYNSWDNLVDELMKESIFTIFEKLRRYKGIRITFKNLAAMKILVGMDNDLLILDTHTAKIFGLNKSEQNKYRTKKRMFLNLLNFSKNITDKLMEVGLNEVTIAKWSLATWFNVAKTRASMLLKCNAG